MSYGGSSTHRRVRLHRPRRQRPHAPLQLSSPGGTGREYLLVDCTQMSRPVAADRTAPGQGREARSLHRDGAGQPAPEHRPERCPGCSSTPTPTRSACPTRGSRSSTRSSTNATTPSPSAPTRPGSTSRRELRGARRPAVLGRHPPARRRLRRARLQPLGRARLHERPELHRPRRRPGARRGPPPRAPARGRRRALRLQPRAAGRLRRRVRASATARRSSARSPRSSAAWKRVGPHRPARACCASSRRSPASTCPSMYDVEYDGPRHPRRSRPRYPDVPGGRRQAHGRRPRRLAVPEAAARPAHRGGARPAQRRDLPRLHPRLPLLPGRDDHPPGPRAARGAGPHDGARRPAPHRLRRGRAHVAVERRLLRDRRARRRSRQRAGAARGSVGLSLPSLRVDAFTVGLASEIQKVRRTGLTFAPEAGRGGCAR